jgi:hypothetical protein
MEASGLAAIATAVDLIRSGVVEGAVAGAVDEWSGAYGAAWGRLRLTHRGEPGEFPGPCAQNRRGFTPGEGAYLVMLESRDRARRRGAVPWAEVKGETIAHARGPAHAWPRDSEDVAEAIRDALTQAGLGPDEIGYVAASANGTRALDAVEARALRLALGGGLRRVPVTSVKGAVGESAAASAVGTNIVGANDLGASEPQMRQVAKIAVLGSAVAGDARVDLFYGLTFIGTFVSTRAGAVPTLDNSTDWQDVDVSFALEAGEPLRIVVSDAGLTNVIVCFVKVEYI